VGHIPGPRSVPLPDLVQQPGASRLGEQLAAVAHQPTHRHDEFHAHASVGVGRHLLEFGLAGCQGLAHRPDELRRDVHRDALVGLPYLAILLAQQHFGARYLELVALAPHLLDQHGKLELAAAAHLEGVR